MNECSPKHATFRDTSSIKIAQKFSTPYVYSEIVLATLVMTILEEILRAHFFKFQQFQVIIFYPAC